MASDAPRQYVPLTCHGHSRPVPHISFSPLRKDDVYYMISACKGTSTATPSPGYVALDMLTLTKMETLCSAMVRLATGACTRPATMDLLLTSIPQDWNFPRSQGSCVAGQAEP